MGGFILLGQGIAPACRGATRPGSDGFWRRHVPPRAVRPTLGDPAGRPFQAIFNALLWLAGLVLLVLPFIPGLMTWGLAVLWAVLVVRGRKQEMRDRRLIDAALERDRAGRVG